MTQDNRPPGLQPTDSDAQPQHAKAAKETGISSFTAKLVMALNRMATDEDFRKAVEKRMF